VTPQREPWSRQGTQKVLTSSRRVEPGSCSPCCRRVGWTLVCPVPSLASLGDFDGVGDLSPVCGRRGLLPLRRLAPDVGLGGLVGARRESDPDPVAACVYAGHCLVGLPIWPKRTPCFKSDNTPLTSKNRLWRRIPVQNPLYPETWAARIRHRHRQSHGHMATGSRSD
jgi:hypothetical protein